MAKQPKHKQPKVAGALPQPEKKPKFANDPTVDGSPMVWRFSHADRDGPFAWPNVFAEHEKVSEVLIKLAEFETLDETRLRESGSHPVPLESLSKEAQDRLEAIRQDDLDTLYSLRITGKRRVWAIHHGRIMRVLWYDPEHLVCPSEKKHS